MQPLRVALNATPLLAPLTGIGHYTRQLALGLAAEPGLQAGLFLGTRWSPDVPPPAPAQAAAGTGLLRRIPGSYALRRLVQGRRFAAGARRGRYDVYHEPAIVPLPFDGPTVVTVHDLSWIHHPESHPAARVRALDRHFQTGLRQASVLVTDSRFVRDEVVATFGFPADRIRVVPLAAEGVFVPRDAAQAAPALGRHGLAHGAYLLLVGTLEPRKNIATALAAYSRLPARLRAAHPLVLAGMRGWHTGPIERLLEPLERAGEVRRLGYLGREDLACITAGALALVYPSRYEGFGLPPLEAMACRVPAITSNASSLPEVVGDAGLMADPGDVDAFTAHMQALLSDPGLREALAARALDRAARFDWRRCVAQTVDAYRLAVSAPSVATA